jgi:hypothetical protein
MSDKVPHDCPICELMFRDMSDIISYEELGCCTDCQDHFAYRDLKAWMSGSRPTQEQAQEFRQTLQSRASYLVAKL